MSLKDLPSPNAPNFSLRVREMLHTMLGKTGSADERLLTLREAVASGVVKPGPGGSLVPGDAIGGGTGGEAYVPDLTPPPAPDTLTATPAISHILLEVPAATYTQGHGHLRTRVYGVTRLSGDPAPVFADAVEVGQFSGTIWAFPSNPSTTWHFWAKWESVDGVLSATPVGGTNGVSATTGQDVSSLLDALAGQISTSELATSLATRIDLIDGTGPGSVAQRIADEATARAAAILVETNARDAADAGLQGQIDLLAASVGGDLSDLLDAVNQERTDRIADVLDAENAAAAADALLNSALVAEAIARSGADSDLAVQASAIAAATAGNAAAVVQAQQASATETGALASATAALASASAGNAAAVRTEEQARTDADSAQAARVQAVSASAADSAAAVRTEQATRATDDSALAAQSVVLAAKTADNTAGLVHEATVRAADDSAAAAVSAGILAQAQGAAAAISVEQGVSAAADAALAAQVAVQVSQVGAQAAAIQQEALTRADADTAQALQVQSVSAAAGQGLAAVRTEESARVAADAAQSATSSALAASFAGNVAAIVTEQAARTTWDTSLAQRADVLSAAVASNAAAILTQQQVQVGQDGSLASQISTVAVAAAGNEAAIQTEATTRASQTGDLFAKYTVKVDVAGHVGGYGFASKGNAADPVTLTPGLYDVDSSRILSVQRNSTATYIDSSGVLHTAPANTARYQGGQLLVEGQATNFVWPAKMADELYNCTGVFVSGVLPDGTTSNTIFRVSPSGGANVRIGDTLSGTPGTPYSGSVYARSVDGGTYSWNIDLNDSTANTFEVGPQWVRMSASNTRPDAPYRFMDLYPLNGSTAQVEFCFPQITEGGLSSYIPTTAAPATRAADIITVKNDAVTSEFGIRADQFFVAPPATSSATAPTADLYKGMVWVDTSVTPNVTRYYTGSAWSTTPQALPFVVQVSPTTINGVAVPPGAYFNDAFIQNGTITNAKIANLAVDDAKIANLSVSKLTAGSIAVGQYAQSTGYVAGSSGWRINGDGNAEFSNAIVRGTVYATDGEFTGTVRGATIVGSTITTADSGQRIKMDAEGILFLTGASNGKYGSFKYGSKKYGDGVLVYFNNTVKRVPFYVNSEQNVADIHLYNRATNPPPGEPGDIICVNSRLKTWDGIEGRWRTLAFSD